MNEYIKQTKGHTCLLIALINARVYHGLPVDELKEDTDAFDELAELGGCLYGSCTKLDELANELGMACVVRRGPGPGWVEQELNQGHCVLLTISAQNWNLHSALIVGFKWAPGENGLDRRLFECVNAQVHSTEATIEWLTWEELSQGVAATHRLDFESCYSVSPRLL